MSWLDDILESRINFESPKRFWYWSALAAISAVVKKNVYYRKKDPLTKKVNYILYPNIYVFLVGDSAVARKGPPIAMARRLVGAVDVTRVISGRSSIQGIIKEIATMYTTPTGKIRNDSSCFLCASELRSSIVTDPQAISILTDLHDGHFSDEWKSLLKGTGTESLKDVNMVILAGSNPAYLRETITGSDIEGGLIGRSFMVYENTRQTINSLTGDVVGDEEDTLNDKNVDEKEVKWLKELSELKGKFLLSLQARDMYNDWYNEFTVRIHTDKTGTVGRLHDQVLKAAMLISLSRKQTLIIEQADMDEAINACVELAGNVGRSIMPAGKSAFASQTNLVLQELITAYPGEASRHKLLQKHYGEFDAFDLDRIIETLLNAHAVKVRKDGKNTYYKLSDDAFQQFEDFKKRSIH